MDTPSPLVARRFVEPPAVITHFHLREGDKVGDFGAGSGYFVELLSKQVGDEGKVYACEIQRDLVDKLGVLVRQKDLDNVDPLWCDAEEPNGTKIDSHSLDAALLVNTLFQMEDKESALAEIKRTLRSGGKLCVIDWSESFGGLGPQASQVVSESSATSLAESAGFVYERSFDAGDHHYGLAFRKP